MPSLKNPSKPDGVQLGINSMFKQYGRLNFSVLISREKKLGLLFQFATKSTNLLQKSSKS